MQQFVKKMITERDDLKGKITRAKKAIENPPFGSDEEGIRLLIKQVEAMEQYFYWLQKRIEKEGAN